MSMRLFLSAQARSRAPGAPTPDENRWIEEMPSVRSWPEADTLWPTDLMYPARSTLVRIRHDRPRLVGHPGHRDLRRRIARTPHRVRAVAGIAPHQVRLAVLVEVPHALDLPRQVGHAADRQLRRAVARAPDRVD